MPHLERSVLLNGFEKSLGVLWAILGFFAPSELQLESF
jgi:hypothetical protein